MKNLARTFKAISDETRLRILALLTRGELCVCDLMAILDLPQSTVSRHLATLRHAGLVEDRRQGLWMFYRLAATAPLHRDLLDLIEKHATGLPQAGRDRESLIEFQARGKTCG
ncbi:MAG: metalloregulator ArsR/SmtB family transcription factor [Desulfuromonadales bacterium]